MSRARPDTEAHDAQAGASDHRARVWLAYLALALAVLAFTVPPTWLALQRQVGFQHDLVGTVARLKAEMVETWFEERLASAWLLASSEPFAVHYLQWVEEGDEEAREATLTRLRQYLTSSGFSQALLLDAQRGVVWRSEGLVDHEEVRGAITALLQAGPEPGSVEALPPYRDDAGRLHIDVASSLSVPASVPVPMVVSHADPADLFAAGLRSWPVPSESGAFLLFAPSNDGALVVQEPTAAEAGELVARFVTWEEASSSLMREVVAGAPDAVRTSGHDLRGVPVLAAGVAAGGSGWFVLAQIDRGEALAGANRLVARAGALALLAFALGVLALGWLRQRQRLAVAEGVQAAQAERIRDSSLLQAIVDSSPDLVFAKDLDGRYLVFNRAAAAVFGRDPSEMVGRDAGALFSPEKARALRANEEQVLTEDRTITFEDVVQTPRGERVFLATKGPLRDERGRLFGVFAVSRDITDQRRAERALEEQRRELQRSVEELERFNRAMVGRELTVVGLKRRVNELSERLGEPAPFDMSTFDGVAGSGDG